MNKNWMGVLFGMLWTATVLAQPAPIPSDLDEDEDDLVMMGGPGMGHPDKPGRQAMKEQMRIGRTLRLAEAAGLNEQQALRVSDALKGGEEVRKKLRQDMKARVLELRALAEGSPSQKDVDAKIRQIQDLRGQVMKVEADSLEAAAKGLSPQQKAKLAIALGASEKRMRQVMFQEMERRRGGMAPGQPMPPNAPLAPQAPVVPQ